jgi:hypothetical protein
LIVQVKPPYSTDADVSDSLVCSCNLRPALALMNENEAPCETVLLTFASWFVHYSVLEAGTWGIVALVILPDVHTLSIIKESKKRVLAKLTTTSLIPGTVIYLHSVYSVHRTSRTIWTFDWIIAVDRVPIGKSNRFDAQTRSARASR